MNLLHVFVMHELDLVKGIVGDCGTPGQEI